MNVALFGSRVFADDPVKMKWWGWALIQYDCILIKKGDWDSETDAYRVKLIWWHKDKAIYKPRTHWNHQKLAERHRTDLPWKLSEGPALMTPWFRLLSPRTMRQHISVVKSFSQWWFNYSRPRNWHFTNSNAVRMISI